MICTRLHIKCPLFLSDFNETCIFPDRFVKNTSYFIKILPVGAELFHADGRTDMTKVIVAYRNFLRRSLKKYSDICLNLKLRHHR